MLGCGSSGTQGQTLEQGPPIGGSNDAAAAAADAGDEADAAESGPHAPYPAFAPEMPKVVDNGGGALKSPKIVTITFASDTNTSSLQDFGDEIGASSYWKKTVAEYGVGAATSGSAHHVVVATNPPSPWDDAAMETWLVNQIQDPNAKWPQPDAQTFYLLYVPASIQVTSGGQDECNNAVGYHTEETVGSNPNVPAAFVFERCHDPNTPVLEAATETSAHEIVETVTDPHPDSAYAWGGFDANHLAWELWEGWTDELADACQFFSDANEKEGSDLPFWVQRTWSNASAKAGHDPCVPAPSAPYFNTTPLALDAVQVSAIDAIGKPQTFSTKGWHVAPGQTRTVKIGFYSDAAIDAWSLQALEGDGFSKPKTPALTLALSQDSGDNGDQADLSITASAQKPAQTGVLMTLVSTKGNLSHYMPVVVGVY